MFSGVTPYTTGRTVVGNVVTFTGASFNDNDFFSLACPLIPGPGGVAGTTAWLRADEDVYNNAGITPAANGQTVQQWGSASSNFVTQLTGGNKPAFQTSLANFNPVVTFGTTKFMDFASSLGVTNSSDLQMTLVFRPNAIVTSGSAADKPGQLLYRPNNQHHPDLLTESFGTEGHLTRATRHRWWHCRSFNNI